MTQDNNLKAQTKNWAGKITGFVAGAAGFLFVFKIFVLDVHSPDDELAPGIVMLLALISGLVFSFVGSWAQRYLAKGN